MSDVKTPEHVNVFFRLSILAGGAFVVTILAFFATLFGDSRSPLAQMLTRHAGRIFGIELVALIVFGLLAMMVDRRQTLRAMRNVAVPTPGFESLSALKAPASDGASSEGPLP